MAAQTHVEGEVRRSIAATPLENRRVLVTPAPLNSLLWRVIVMDDDAYHEGFRSLFDTRARIPLERHASDPKLLDSLRDERTVRRLARFSKGFYSVRMANRDLRVADGAPGTFSQLLGAVTTAQAAPVGSDDATRPIVMTDLRMGQTPWFVFSFVVAEHGAKGITCRAEPSDCECAPTGHGTALVVAQDLGRGRDVLKLNRWVRDPAGLREPSRPPGSARGQRHPR